MSEKRFELILIKYNDENDVDESWWAIKDNETDKTMQDVETVELLNELNNENEQLKKEKEGWKLSTCRYINKDSVLMMDCQIVHEALFELERLIEEDTEQMGRFNDLKDNFKSLVNHYLGVFDDE